MKHVTSIKLSAVGFLVCTTLLTFNIFYCVALEYVVTLKRTLALICLMGFFGKFYLKPCRLGWKRVCILNWALTSSAKALETVKKGKKQIHSVHFPESWSSRRVRLNLTGRECSARRTETNSRTSSLCTQRQKHQQQQQQQWPAKLRLPVPVLWPCTYSKRLEVIFRSPRATRSAIPLVTSDPAAARIFTVSSIYNVTSYC